MMVKRLTILLEDDLYLQLLARAGGPRKVSVYLNSVLRTRLMAPETPTAEAGTPLADLQAEVTRLGRVVAALQAQITPPDLR